MSALSDLDLAIAEANAASYSITLAQHPDATPYWEARLSRRAGTSRNGIIREVLFAIATTPADAIATALSAEPETQAPSGTSVDTTGESLASLLARAFAPTPADHHPTRR